MRFCSRDKDAKLWCGFSILCSILYSHLSVVECCSFKLDDSMAWNSGSMKCYYCRSLTLDSLDLCDISCSLNLRGFHVAPVHANSSGSLEGMRWKGLGSEMCNLYTRFTEDRRFQSSHENMAEVPVCIRSIT